MSPRPDFDLDEITEHGQTNGRVRELSDPDSLVMLGRLASAVARCEASLAEAVKSWTEEREEARSDRRALLRATKRGAASTVGLVGVLQALILAAQHTGLLK